MADTSFVAAKKEYTEQLCDVLKPLIFKGLKSIWKNSINEKNKQSLKTFQEKLTSVPIWNQNIIDNEYARIAKETDCEWLDKLIEAVFLSYVKVLSTIRIGKSKTINIKVPETRKFFHNCYIECARMLWQDPHLIDDREDILTFSEIKRNNKRLYITIKESIEKTISKSIPIQSILENYLNEVENESDNGSDNSSDNENTSINKGSDKEFENVKQDESKELITEKSIPVYDTTEFMEEPSQEPELNVSQGYSVEDSSEKYNYNQDSYKPQSTQNIQENKNIGDYNNNNNNNLVEKRITINSDNGFVSTENNANNDEDLFFSDSDDDN